MEEHKIILQSKIKTSSRRCLYDVAEFGQESGLVPVFVKESCLLAVSGHLAVLRKISGYRSRLFDELWSRLCIWVSWGDHQEDLELVALVLKTDGARRTRVDWELELPLWSTLDTVKGKPHSHNTVSRYCLRQPMVPDCKGGHPAHSWRWSQKTRVRVSMWVLEAVELVVGRVY